MASRPVSAPRSGKLETPRLIEITDPAEQAAVTRIFFNDRPVSPEEAPAGPSIIQQFFKQLSPESRLDLVGHLAAGLPASAQCKLVAQLLPSLPPAGRRKLEATIRTRSKAS